MQLLKLGMMAINSVVAGSLAIAAVGVRGSGTVQREERKVKTFSRIRSNTLGEIIVHQGDHTALTIECDENLLEYFTTDVIDDTLVISSQPNTSISNITHLRFEITVKQLEELVLDGVAQVTLNDLDVPKLHIEINGTGSVTARGSATTQTIALNGTGSYDAQKLTSETVKVAVNGIGSARINVSETLHAQINGMGSIMYTGNPEIRKSVNGMGAIKRQN